MPPPSSRALTLAQLSQHLSACGDITPRQQVELRSAINTFARVCDRDPADVVADPAVIRTLAAKAQWKLAGLTKGTWANIVSRLGKAMQLGGVRVHRQRRNYQLAEQWEQILGTLARRDRDELRRFAGWCSVYEIAPASVCDATLQRYLAYLEDQSLQQRPRERCHVARRAWNRTVARLGPPYRRLQAVLLASTKALRWTDCSASLQQEVKDYAAAVMQVDVFDASRTPLQPTTVRGYLNQLRWYAAALVEVGVPIEALTDLKALVDPAHAKRGLQARLGNRKLDENSRSGLHAMATALLSVAGYLKVPAEQLEELRRIAKKVEHRPHGMCAKNKERLAPLQEDVRLRQRLLNLPIEVADRLRGVTKPTPHQALLMQRACLLEILLHVPVRIKNAAGLHLGTTILRPAGGKEGRWRISIPCAEVKNHVPIDALLGEETSALIARYVDVFRPVLIGAPTPALFVSMGQGAKGSPALSHQLARFIRSEIGLTMHAHLLRHFAAFQYLQDNPGDYETVRRMLGHKQIATTVSFYAGLETDQAFARYDELIARERAQRSAGDL